MHPLAAAVTAGDHDAIERLLSEDVVFTSPVAFKPYPGKQMTALILRTVITVFEDFHYVREIVSDGGLDAVLEFEATVDGRSINGVDMLRLNAEGLIIDFKVMVRPLSAAQALADRMAVAYAKAVEIS